MIDNQTIAAVALLFSKTVGREREEGR